jgi:hypothetical protein
VPQEMHLSHESIEALAGRLAELLGGASPKPAGRGEEEMITAAEVAWRWGISRRWVYGHAGALGAMRLGGGPRPRLRFDPAEVAERLGAPAVGPRPGRPDMRRSTGSAGRGGSDSLSPPTRAMFVESQIAAGGRPEAPGPAPEEAPRRAPGHRHGARLRPPPTDPRRGGAMR